MSTRNNHSSVIHVTAVVVSAESGKNTKLASGELRIGARLHKLICDRDGTLRQDFPNLIELSPESQITLHYKASWLPFSAKVQVIDTQHLFENSVGTPTREILVGLKDGIWIKFSCRNTEIVSLAMQSALTAEGLPHTVETIKFLTPTTDAILENCPRFRILVIGKSGVGKSSLINTAFGINDARSADLQRGIANIDRELVSPVNKRFILHDSLGFEPGDEGNYQTVKQFIQDRQTGALKDQLHAVWFCLQIPRAGGRLLEAAAEDFFQTKKETMGTIPLIVVYTMFDMSVNEAVVELATSSQGKLDEESAMKHARSKAQSSVRERHDEITQFSGDSLPYMAISTKDKYKPTLEDLVELTYRQVRERVAPEAQIRSVVPLIAAQRVVPDLKIQGTIDVGRQRYWKALRSSPNFQGHKTLDCLSVIHADIIAVWNFNDPDNHLSEKEFMQFVIKMAEEVQTPSAEQTNNAFVLGGGSVMGVISALLPIASNPAAPIVIPIIAGVVVAAWLYKVYQDVKNVQQIFMAFIVDLTYILDTLFVLTARDHNKLTRRTIKAAYKIYHDSGVMNSVHGDIKKYRDLGGKDTALEMIECLIRPERGGDVKMRNYRAEVGKVDISKLNLDQEEEWCTSE